MARFTVRDCFILNQKPWLVLQGAIADGTIRTGMKARSPNHGFDAVIDQIEFARNQGGPEDVCLVFGFTSPESGKRWDQINFKNETLEITPA